VNFLTEHHAIKAYWGSGGNRGEWLASRPGDFTPGERARGIHWIGGLVGPRTGLDEVTKRKIPSAAGNMTPVVQNIAQSLY
jgi:hypothetical protein